MCIEMAKTGAKHKKQEEHLHGHPSKLESIKNGGRRRVEKNKCGWCMPRDLILVVLSTLPPLFTKLSLCHSKLQKCHY